MRAERVSEPLILNPIEATPYHFSSKNKELARNKQKIRKNVQG
jgi:hypothetical protein